MIFFRTHSIRWSLLITGILSVWTTNTAAAAERARLKTGSVLEGRLDGKSARDLAFQTTGKPQPLETIERIDFPRTSPVLQNERPARVFFLRGGGQITGELLKFTKQNLTLKLRGKIFSLPTQAVLAITQPRGEQQLFYEDFESALSSDWKTTGIAKPAEMGNRSALEILPGRSLTRTLQEPLTTGRLSLAVYDPGPKTNNHCGVQLQFIKPRQESAVTIHLPSEKGVYTAFAPPQFDLTIQPLRPSRGWQQLTVLWDDTRFQVFLGSHLLGFGRSLDAGLNSIRLFSESGASQNRNSQTERAGWFDDVQLAGLARQSENVKHLSMEEQGQAVLENGDVIYGRVEDIDSHAVQMRGAFGTAALPWNRLQQVVLGNAAGGEKSASAPDRVLTGWHADVQFQRFADHPYRPPDRVAAVLISADAETLTLDHAWLGRFNVPIEQLEELRPRFLGVSRVLTFDVLHLGNQVEPAFRAKQPVGHQYEGEFQFPPHERPPESFPPPPRGKAFLRLDVAELEPAGPGTPPGSRFLSKLRNGQLGTWVSLNGHSLGRLNAYISQRNTLKPTQSIRLPIPAGVLKAGTNTWRLEQTPLKDKPGEYDDCEIGPVVLEIEQK